MVASKSQELGFEVLNRQEIQQRLLGSGGLLATINLLKISHRNEQVWHQILEECPDGILVDDPNNHYFTQTEQRLVQAKKKKEQEIVFQHRDEFGQLWE